VAEADASSQPELGGPRGFVLIDGANEVAAVWRFWWVVRHWPRLRRALTGSPGYIGHRLWFRWPRTIGLMSWWTEEKDAYRFAYTPAHLEFWRWGHQSRHTRGGWLALYRYVDGGPLWGNGVETLARTFAGVVPPPSGAPARPPPGR
jgi:hypothetical protein